MIAESLWRSRVVDALIWISVTGRAPVLSWSVQAPVAATGLEPTGTAESAAVRWRTSAKADGRDEFRVPMPKGPDFS